MKMDIESFEIHAILGGLRLFEKKVVKILIMEFVHLKRRAKRTIDFYEQLEKAMNFLLIENAYEVYSFPAGQKLEFEKWQSWTNEIVFAQPGFWRGSVATFKELAKIKKFL